MKPRPHWSQEFIEAVEETLEDDAYSTRGRTLAVIQQIEDWVVSAHLSGVFVAEYQQAKAQVQAVRELHAAKDCGCCCAECPDGWPCHTIRALDGDA